MSGFPEGFGQFEVEHVTSAPAADVYEAFLDPELISRWFGPTGWSVPRDTITVERREGGAYAFQMVNEEDESQSSPVDATIDELRESRYIRATDRGGAELGLPSDVVMETLVEETEQGTRILIRQAPLPEVVFEPATAGWKSSFGKLDALLEERAEAQRRG